MKELKKEITIRTEKRQALTLEEQQAFLQYIQDHETYGHWYPLFYILANTGMRIAEALGLRWVDIDLDDGIIDINHTLIYLSKRGSQITKTQFIINTPKTKAGRRQIPMMTDVKKAFKLQKELMSEWIDVSQPFDVEGYTGFIFLNRFGEGLHYGVVNKAIKRIIRDYNSESGEDAVKLPSFSCHTFRHTFATRMCEAGVNVKAMQEILGHSDVRVTLGIYADATKDFKRSEVSVLESFLQR